MRNLAAILFVVALSFPMSALAGAGYGSAHIPYWWSYHNASSPYENQEMIVNMANVSNAPVAVEVSFFQNTGGLLQDGDDSTSAGVLMGTSNALYWDDNPTDASVSFEIPAQQSVTVRIRTTSQMAGFGLIEWAASSRGVRKALVAQAFKMSVSQQLVPGVDHLDGSLSIPINGGMPF